MTEVAVQEAGMGTFLRGLVRRGIEAQEELDALGVGRAARSGGLTVLRKTVRRRTDRPYDHRGKRIMVSLEPGDIITMREERSRKSFSASIARVFRQLMIWAVDEGRREAALRRWRKPVRSV